MVYTKSRDELEQELREQLEALRFSCLGYDEGRRWEAKRIAAIAYIILHDGGRNSRSLFGQLGQKPELLSTKARDPEASFHLTNITFSIHDGVWFSPRLDSNPEDWKWLRFGKWYEECVLESGRIRISRKNLIHTFRSTMGGSHVDPNIENDSFRWFQNNGPLTANVSRLVNSNGGLESVQFTVNVGESNDEAVRYGPEAAMRQIGWEILRSIGEGE